MQKGPPGGDPFYYLMVRWCLFLALGGDEVAVHARDVAHLDVLRALSGTCAGIGAVSEAEFVHARHHAAHTARGLNLTLRQKRELAHLCGDEEHRGTILAGSNACAAADA